MILINRYACFLAKQIEKSMT